MSVSAQSINAVRRDRATHFGAASLAMGLLALLHVAPLAAQNAKSLLDLLANPQAQDMPPLVRASSDGVMLAGKPIVQAIPRVTLAAHRGEKLAPADPQRLAAASPDIIVPTRIEPTRLASHFLTTENKADRAVLNAVFAGKIPSYFQNIEPATNAPKIDFVKPDVLAAVFTQDLQPMAPDPEVTLQAAALPLLTAMAAPDPLTLPDGYLMVPPPPVKLAAVKPQTLPAAKPDLTVLAPVLPGLGLAAVRPDRLPGQTPAKTALTPLVPGLGLAAVVPPTIKGQLVSPVTPDAGKLTDALPGTLTPDVTEEPVLPQLTGTDLNKALQTELLRLNCLKGKADGSFGKGSQGALDLFFRTTGQARASNDLDQSLFDQLKAAADNTCANPYAPVVQAQNPVPKTKPATTKPAPTKPAKAAAPVKTPKPAAPAKPAQPKKSNEDPCVKNPASCLSFN